MSNTKDPREILIIGGGIGGVATALALARRGMRSHVFEKAPEFGEIGYGIQQGPNAYRMLDWLGVMKDLEPQAVFTKNLILIDALTDRELTRISCGEAFRKRYRRALHGRAPARPARRAARCLPQARRDRAAHLEGAGRFHRPRRERRRALRRRLGVRGRGADRRRRPALARARDRDRRRPAAARRSRHLPRRRALRPGQGPVALRRHGDLGRAEPAFRAVPPARRHGHEQRRHRGEPEVRARRARELRRARRIDGDVLAHHAARAGNARLRRQGQELGAARPRAACRAGRAAG